MSRIASAFARGKAEERALLIGYLTAFDADRAQSFDRLVAACEAGLDILELGVPFSDPAADGPAIQRAMARGLAAGASLAGTLALAAEVRARVDTPIVLFSYGNPLLQFGPARLAQAAAAAGIDGLLAVDIPPEESSELRGPARAAGLDWIPLLAPTTTPVRRRRIVATATGFAYLVSLKGVTGASLRADDPALAQLVNTTREECPVPVAVGFGIRTPDDAGAVAQLADGVVVGTALVEAAEQGLEPLRSTVAKLRRAVDRR